MSDMTVRARSLPYREPRPGTYTCGRCGRTCDLGGTRKNSGYCTDCKSEAIALGWITKPEKERKAA